MIAITCPACLHTTPVLSHTPGTPITCLRCRAVIPAEALVGPGPDGGAPAQTAGTHPVQAFTGVPGGSPAGFVAALAFGLAAAIVLGFAAAFLRQHFWFVLIFAALLGLGIGAITGLGAKVGRYRQ